MMETGWAVSESSGQARVIRCVAQARFDTSWDTSRAAHGGGAAGGQVLHCPVATLLPLYLHLSPGLLIQFTNTYFQGITMTSSAIAIKKPFASVESPAARIGKYTKSTQNVLYNSCTNRSGSIASG